MNAWGNLDSAVGGLTSNFGSSTLGDASTIFKAVGSDPLFSSILASKKSLQVVLEAAIDSSELRLESRAVVELLMAACEGDLVTTESIARSSGQLINSLYPSEEAGLTPLIYAIAFDQIDVVEALLDHNADPDQHDTLVKHYTPLMWAIHFNRLGMVKLLLDHQADPYLAPVDDDQKLNAVSLVYPENTAIYEFFKSHNLLKQASTVENDDGYYSNFPDDNVDDLTNQLKLQSISATSALGVIGRENENEEEDYDEEQFLSRDHELVQTPVFEYDKLLPEQYIKFTDSDIPSLLEYIFGLRTDNLTLQHDAKVPAAIVFQLLRYSHLKVDSKELTEFLFDCFLVRLRSVTNTKSGVFNMAVTTADTNGDKKHNQTAAAGAGDIVLLSYWLSVIQFLHFYLSRNEIYKAYPQFLQELINVIQSLIATLSFSINSRLNILLDDCLLNFTSLVDVSNVLYAKDWNLFKSKAKVHPSTYDDIFDMLYPPSQTELMKPSPLRYVQVLGALDYVLKLHDVDTLLQFQTFSQVFYYINASIFNKIINNSKYCSRSKAIQLRLNISTIEDWLRSHNYKVYKPDTIGGLEKFLPDDNENPIILKNLLDLTNDSKDPHSLSFYYNTLYHIGKNQLAPTIELLQWLQCMSASTDGDSLINTINQFDSLNYYQLFKVMNKLYKYEVDEPKVPKELVNFLKKLMNEQGENQVSANHLHYITQTSFLLKDHYITLNTNFIFGVTLPNAVELINNYGAGLGGMKVLKAKKFQPLLPISVMDDIDDIRNQNRENNVNDTYDYEDNENSDDNREVNNESVLNSNSDFNSEAVPKQDKVFKGDELFKQVQLPNSLAHKEWGNDDIEANPW